MPLKEVVFSVCQFVSSSDVEIPEINYSIQEKFPGFSWSLDPPRCTWWRPTI